MQFFLHIFTLKSHKTHIFTFFKSEVMCKTYKINLTLDWTKPSFQSESIRRIDATDWNEMNRIKSNWFRPFFIKQDTKRLSDWFEMIRNSSSTDFGMALIHSDWIQIWNFRQGSLFHFNRTQQFDRILWDLLFSMNTKSIP